MNIKKQHKQKKQNKQNKWFSKYIKTPLEREKYKFYILTTVSQRFFLYVTIVICTLALILATCCFIL